MAATLQMIFFASSVLPCPSNHLTDYGMHLEKINKGSHRRDPTGEEEEGEEEEDQEGRRLWRRHSYVCADGGFTSICARRVELRVHGQVRISSEGPVRYSVDPDRTLKARCKGSGGVKWRAGLTPRGDVCEEPKVSDRAENTPKTQHFPQRTPVKKSELAVLGRLEWRSYQKYGFQKEALLQKFCFAFLTCALSHFCSVNHHLTPGHTHLSQCSCFWTCVQYLENRRTHKLSRTWTF